MASYFCNKITLKRNGRQLCWTKNGLVCDEIFSHFFPEECRFSTPVAAIKKILDQWISAYMEAIFFIYIKGEPVKIGGIQLV